MVNIFKIVWVLSRIVRAEGLNPGPNDRYRRDSRRLVVHFFARRRVCFAGGRIAARTLNLARVDDPRIVGWRQ